MSKINFNLSGVGAGSSDCTEHSGCAESSGDAGPCSAGAALASAATDLASVGDRRVVIIPAAGFGRRIGAPEAKEMLTRVSLQSRAKGHAQSAQLREHEHVHEGAVGITIHDPLIELPLQLAARASAQAVVVTRAEKASLLKYLNQRARVDGECAGESDKLNECDILNPQVCLIEQTREWPESILASQAYWGDFNLVCLPDVDFAPLAMIEKMYEALNENDIVFATFTPQDSFSKWGVVDISNHYHCEKPDTFFEVATNTPLNQENLRAWGLFAFRREFGEQLLKNMLTSTFDHKWHKLEGRVGFLPLDEFADLTR